MVKTGAQVASHLRKIAPRLRSAPLFSKAHFAALARNIATVKNAFPSGIPSGHRLSLPEQLFDSVFLETSSLYRRSRALFLAEGGRFEPKLTTSPRSLGSLILTENRIEYTPHQSEFLWTVEQKPFPRESVQRLITYSTSLFHEQNHRLLWKRVPPPREMNAETLRQYLNFMESLVVVLDMALGDELGVGLSSLGYLTGVLYDPGTELLVKDRRQYRNGLQKALQATFLALEGYSSERIEKALLARSVDLPRNYARRVIARALRLDAEFIERTNPLWQKKYEKELLQLWKSRNDRNSSAITFAPSADPLNWTSEYLIAERVFDGWSI